MPKAKSTSKGKRRATSEGKRKKKSTQQHARSLTPLPQSEIFPFEELPPEIRDKIYSYHLASDTRSNLASFEIPAICQTSRQLRTESLPVLFSERSWFVNIGSNLRDRRAAALNGDEEWTKAHKSRCGNSGVTKMRRELRKTLVQIVQVEKLSIIFRDITFCVVEVEELTQVNRNDFRAEGEESEDKPQYVVCEFRAVWKNDQSAHVTITEGDKHPNIEAHGLFEAEDIDTPAEEAKQIAERHAAECDDFKGFDIMELERIAKPFRYCVTEKEEKLEEKAYAIFAGCLIKSSKKQCKPFQSNFPGPGMGKRFEGRKKKK